MTFSQHVDSLVIRLFGFWCAIRGSTLAHVDFSGSFRKSWCRETSDDTFLRNCTYNYSFEVDGATNPFREYHDDMHPLIEKRVNEDFKAYGGNLSVQMDKDA